MPFPCPGCQAPVSGSLELGALRCPGCKALLRCTVAADEGRSRAYEVYVSGQPSVRRRVVVASDEREARRLSAWLAWASLLTLGLVGVLYALARWG